MKTMRKQLYQALYAPGRGKLREAYQILMILIILASLLPLTVKYSSRALNRLDTVCVAVFIVDYLLRWLTADYRYEDMGFGAFLLYPFTPLAIIDLVAILPSVTVLNQSFKLLRLFRMVRALRVLRAFKLIRYSKNAQIILNVFRRQKEALSYVVVLAVAYIIISALVIFNVEPETFDSFFDAVYWATVSLTTVGYGDIYPVSDVGRVVTMISSLFGIAIIAMPAGIITAGYMTELHDMAAAERYARIKAKKAAGEEKSRK